MFARLPAPSNPTERRAPRPTPRLLRALPGVLPGMLTTLVLLAACTAPLTPPDQPAAPAAQAADSAQAAEAPAAAPASGAGEPVVTSMISATAVLTAPGALTATVVATEAPADAIEPAAAAEPSAVPDVTLTITDSSVLTAATAISLSAPLTVAFANAPVALAFPELELMVPVQPMGWELVRSDGVRSTRWLLPTDAAGWHPGSAGAGEAGNLLISGSQLLGAAVFAPLALGEVEPGQEIVVTSATGAEYAYSVVELSEPLALANDAEADAALVAYLQPTLAAGVARLTLVTGWPDFTTTHRIVVVAERQAAAP